VPDQGALDGIVVADFSRVLAGPLATMHLADLGATVIKVERPGTGDDTRTWGPPFADDGQSAYFRSVNRNKRSVALDLATDRDRARELVRRADVLVENFLPGTMDRFGLGWEQARALNPRLVYCSITGFGRDSNLAGYDFVVQAVGGLMSVTGQPDGEPLKVGVALVDVLTGQFALAGILAALHARHRTGEGQRVEVNLLSSLLSGLVNQSSAYLTTGISPVALGNVHPSIAPYETLRTKDHPLAVAAGNDRLFAALCQVLGRPELATDARFATNADRVAHRDELAAGLEAELARDTARVWAERLGAAGVPCGPVQDIGEAFAYAESLGLAPVAPGPVPTTANPIRLSATPVEYRTPPPGLGADTADVLDWLDAPPDSRILGDSGAPPTPKDPKLDEHKEAPT
jgi:crotonobetainyl-CoA:carnitine CoA-transferase CaiB-like acyl-CoA transferase